MRYAGTTATEQGNCGPGFDSTGKAPATLLVDGENIEFLPSDGITALLGHVNEAGHFVAGSNTTGADRKPFPQVFEGDRAGDRVLGRFASPRCRAVVSLTRR